jgi:uncharacterized protein YcnI
MRLRNQLMVIGALIIGTPSAYAHTVIEPKTVEADTYQKLTFRVTHGCDGSPTKEVLIEIPESLRGARPMPKAGWTLQTISQKLAAPYTSHGKTITEDVRTVIWKDGNLPSEWFDEFAIQVKIPVEAGKIAIPVIQTCASGKLEWIELPSGDTSTSLKSPAPLLEVIPATPMGMEHHH